MKCKLQFGTIWHISVTEVVFEPALKNHLESFTRTVRGQSEVIFPFSTNQCRRQTFLWCSWNMFISDKPSRKNFNGYISQRGCNRGLVLRNGGKCEIRLGTHTSTHPKEHRINITITLFGAEKFYLNRIQYNSTLFETAKHYKLSFTACARQRATTWRPPLWASLRRRAVSNPLLKRSSLVINVDCRFRNWTRFCSVW